MECNTCKLGYFYSIFYLFNFYPWNVIQPQSSTILCSISKQRHFKDYIGFSTNLNLQWYNYAANSEAATALSCYNSICTNLSGQPIWAVAENYRFEPVFVEVLVFSRFDLVPIILDFKT
ncbi:hypothetical protein L1049_018961 [Liquidambar formosana]|uniref:Uncharacterized protein n=1 Tax=Liquidambar formosana TaxID=63359 RepID=A0AAP0WMH0_LIQFO